MLGVSYFFIHNVICRFVTDRTTALFFVPLNLVHSKSLFRAEVSWSDMLLQVNFLRTFYFVCWMQVCVICSVGYKFVDLYPATCSFSEIPGLVAVSWWPCTLINVLQKLFSFPHVCTVEIHCNKVTPNMKIPFLCAMFILRLYSLHTDIGEKSFNLSLYTIFCYISVRYTESRLFNLT